MIGRERGLDRFFFYNFGFNVLRVGRGLGWYWEGIGMVLGGLAVVGRRVGEVYFREECVGWVWEGWGVVG